MLEFEDSNLQGFWFFWSPKYGVCCWKVMDLNLFSKFGEVFFFLVKLELNAPEF